MRVAAVILCRKQENYAERIAAALSEQTVKPDRMLVVLDRPGYREEQVVRKAYSGLANCELFVIHTTPENIARPPMLPGVLPFCAGRCRNLALELIDSWAYDLAVFSDGDCIPYTGWLESHLSAAGNAGDRPMVTIGRRRETKWGSHDQRERSDKHPVDIFGTTARTVDQEWHIADSGVLWSCNFGITRPAVELLKKLNMMLYGSEEVFHSDFTGRWGGEDGFLGMECFYGGIPMVTTPVDGNDGVLHIEHPRIATLYKDTNAFMEFLDAKRCELITLLNALGLYSGKFRTRKELVGEAKLAKK